MDQKFNIWTTLFIVSALAFTGIQLGYVLKMGTNATQKYMRVAAPVIYMAGFMAFLLGLYAIKKDDTYVLQFLYGVVMLICLPAALFTISLATIIGGNI